MDVFDFQSLGKDRNAKRIKSVWLTFVWVLQQYDLYGHELYGYGYDDHLLTRPTRERFARTGLPTTPDAWALSPK